MRRKRLGELPSDLRRIDYTPGLPPSWFGLSACDFDEVGNSFLKTEKKIPRVASKYTKIDPLSPLFREDIAKFGFGNIFEDIRNRPLTSLLILAVASALVFDFKKLV